jgi:hypothetical protein
MQPISKVTHHRSEATPSQRIKHVHEDLRAHQSIQTNLKQALTHIDDMGGHLAASGPRIGPIGHSPRSADHESRPTMCRRPTSPTASQYTHGSVWLVLHGGLGRFLSKLLVVPPYIYEGRWFKWRHTTYHSPPSVEPH